MVKFILLLSLLLGSSQMLGQDDVEFVDSDTAEHLNINPDEELVTETEYYEKLDKKNKFNKIKDLQGRARKNRPSSIHTEAEKKNLEALLEQVKKENSNVFKAFGNKDSRQKLQDALVRGDRDAIVRQMSQGDQKAILAQFFKKGEAKKTMQQLLAPYRKMGYRQVHNFLRSRFKGTRFGKFANENPRVWDILSKLLLDRRALPDAVSVIEKKGQLALVVGINIAIFIFGLIIARFKKKFSFFSIKRFLYFIFRIILLNGMRVGVLVYFFSTELGPLFQVVSSSF